MSGMFRPLRADELECRIQSVKQNGLVLLLYKDARADQNVLDETVGPMNWMRSHTRDNANCIVSIWDKDKSQWISKEDTGSESNTEAQKGLASDSFKRACFNWGIGRELYTSPFIWIPAEKCNIKAGKCYDKFKVSEIDYKDGVINALSIYNASKRIPCFSFGKTKRPAKGQGQFEDYSFSPDEYLPDDYPPPESYSLTDEQTPLVEPQRYDQLGLNCSECGVGVSQKVYNFSMKKFGRCLCYGCQKKA